MQNSLISVCGIETNSSHCIQVDIPCVRGDSPWPKASRLERGIPSTCLAERNAAITDSSGATKAALVSRFPYLRRTELTVSFQAEYLYHVLFSRCSFTQLILGPNTNKTTGPARPALTQKVGPFRFNSSHATMTYQRLGLGQNVQV